MERLVVVGNGMAGVACVEQILRHSPKFDITIFGDETHVNYNRILLSSVLAGEKSHDDIVLNGLEWYQRNNIDLRLGVRIVGVDSIEKTVTGDDGSVTKFDKLLLATGSMPLIPSIDEVKKDGVFVFRNLDDTRALLERCRPGLKAVVIGGGLLGLEAARGLQVQGCDVTVVHLMEWLMERQLDVTGGGYLAAKMNHMGITVLLGLSTTAILGNGKVEGVQFKGGGSIPADLVVIAAGIRPNVGLANEAGLEVKRGIVVNDYMETSRPDIFAVGECVQHNGICYGLVAPLIEQGKVLAATITGNKGPKYRGSVLASKLKIMGVDVFSAGEIGDKLDGSEVIRYEDPALGIYRKVTLKDGKLAGVILVGDTADSHRYMDWLRTQQDLASLRRQLLFPTPSEDMGIDVAQMPDSETICGCMGVTKGTIISAIHEKGVNTLAQLKECTRASTGCGSCSGLCQSLLKAVVPEFEEEVRKTMCKCISFSEDQLRHILRSQQLKSVQEVLEIYGNGVGCEICKPALSYMLDMLWCGDHEEDRSARFINDRVHANIQKDATFSVVPRIYGGVTSAAELRRIADVAEKYKVPMVKLTGGQRIDLVGIPREQLPMVWRDLGIPSGHAYTKAFRTCKTCLGSDYCRYGVGNSTTLGIKIEKRFQGIESPHKMKLATAGCPRNCSEATTKDLGAVAIEGGKWEIYLGGAAGSRVRKGEILCTVETHDEVLLYMGRFMQYYRENAKYMERTYDFVERIGIERLRQLLVDDCEGICARLDQEIQAAVDAYVDPWQQEAATPATPNQFTSVLEPVATH